MASHYGYTEEYVLSHTPEWLARKSKQATQEKIDEHRMRIVEGFKGLALFIDLAFNKGREMDQILPPLDKEKTGSSQPDDPFLNTMWWKSG
ncbi:hypothetical protein ACFQ4J_06690 [Laceyella tengchongensis]